MFYWIDGKGTTVDFIISTFKTKWIIELKNIDIIKALSSMVIGRPNHLINFLLLPVRE